MPSKLKKATAGATVALVLAAGVLASTATSADARRWRAGPRWHAGYWYGGSGWYGGYGWGAPVAAGFVGGLALCPVYYGGCGWQDRPVYDAWGNFAGYAPVQVCY